MLLETPTFKETSGLARYIPAEFRKRHNRPAMAAYQRKENEDYLSVNSDEVETINQIAQVYAILFESSARPVSVACPKVVDYNEGAEHVGITIIFNSVTRNWEFQGGGASIAAYTHRQQDHNKSHCGIEYVRIFSDLNDFRFAVRLSRAATYKMV